MYTYSSYKSYIDQNDEFVDQREVLSYFSNSLKRFCLYMVEEEMRLQWLEDKDYSDTLEIEIEIMKSANLKLDSLKLQEVLERVITYYQLSYDEIRAKRQCKQLVKARRAVIYIAEMQENIKLKDVATMLNISQSSVSAVLSDLKNKEIMKKECA